MSVVARYSGVCPECGGRWAPGDQIMLADPEAAPVAASWQHASCPDQPDPLTHDHPVCERCWLSHPEGACDR